jgi:hypothetical protein
MKSPEFIRGGARFSVVSLALCFNYFAAAQAGGTDAHALGGCANAGVHRTQIDIPPPLGNIVRVADAVSGLRLLAADFTLL